jgi:hypothetical protein
MEIPDSLFGNVQQLISIETETALNKGSWFVILGARMFRDGNQWCALLGENIQEGVAGFGKSPLKAIQAFDKAWTEELPDSTNEFCE